MVTWYARFIQNLAELKGPLKTFDTLRLLVTQAPVLARPDLNLSFTLQTDARSPQLGTVLMVSQESRMENILSPLPVVP